MTFDIFQELDANTSRPTGKAYYTYIIGSAPDDDKNLGIASISFSENGDRIVQLYTILDSNQKFETLTVPRVEGVDAKAFKAHFIDTDFECVSR